MIKQARNAGAKSRSAARACLLFALSLLLSLPAAAAELRLLRARPAVVTSTVLVQPPNGAPADTLRLNLDAGGDRYDLRLRPKTHLGALAIRERSRATAYEGRLQGRPGSWVAVTRIGTRWSGMWFDGLHYYGIDSAAELASISGEAADAAPDSSLVFRLSDVSLDGLDFTGDVRNPPKNAEQLVELVSSELSAPMSQLATLVTKRLQVALIADAELYARPGFGSQTATNMVNLLNAADGIFANQIGVQLQSAGAGTIFTDTAAQPFTGTTVAEDLLVELRNYRSGPPPPSNAGLSHLFTGRDLDGTTVGIAYLNSLCGTASASVSQVLNSSALSALVMVHEIGHVFGAPHDTETGSACETTPSGFVMGPQLNINNQMFSDCSLQQIAPVVAAASCLANADAADAAIEIPQTALLAVNRPTDVTITVRSVGNIPVNSVNLQITLPVSITLVDANGPTASCGLRVNNIVNCALGSIAPGAVATVTLRVQFGAPGTANIGLRVSAANDGLATNNTTTLQLQAAEGADLAVTASANPLALQLGATTVATFMMENRGPATATDARLNLTIPAGLSVLTQGSELTVCATVTNGLSCGPSILAAAATARVTVTLRADVAGTQTIAASASSSAPELQASDNTAQLTLTVTAPPPVVTPPAPTPTPKGGGGRMPPELLAGLAMLWLALHARRGAQARSK